MHHSYVNMVFDNDPTAEHERLAKLSNKQRRRISGLLNSLHLAQCFLHHQISVVSTQAVDVWQYADLTSSILCPCMHAYMHFLLYSGHLCARVCVYVIRYAGRYEGSNGQSNTSTVPHQQPFCWNVLQQVRLLASTILIRQFLCRNGNDEVVCIGQHAT